MPTSNENVSATRSNGVDSVDRGGISNHNIAEPARDVEAVVNETNEDVEEVGECPGATRNTSILMHASDDEPGEARGDTESGEFASGASSTEEIEEFKCVICLDAPEDPNDIAHVSGCMHRFCFKCIVQWAGRNKMECPLCKTLFDPIRLLIDYMRVEQNRLQEEGRPIRRQEVDTTIETLVQMYYLLNHVVESREQGE